MNYADMGAMVGLSRSMPRGSRLRSRDREVHGVGGCVSGARA